MLQAFRQKTSRSSTSLLVRGLSSAKYGRLSVCSLLYHLKPLADACLTLVVHTLFAAGDDSPSKNGLHGSLIENYFHSCRNHFS